MSTILVVGHSSALVDYPARMENQHVPPLPSRRLTLFRKAKQMSQEDLAQAAGTTNQQIGRLEHGVPPTGRKLTYNWAVRLAAPLGRKPEDFFVNIDNEGLTDVTLPLVRVPLISWIKATDFTEVIDPYEPGDGEGEVYVAYSKETLIALKVEGRSMNRVAPEGSVIIIDYTDKTLISGKYYVIKWDGKATFKRYRSNPDRFEPESTDQFETIFPQGPIEVVGRVVKQQNDM